MYYDNRPLETLASYAIAFASGMLAAAALGVYSRWVKKMTVIHIAQKD
jgi:hypothetical protein